MRYKPGVKMTGVKPEINAIDTVVNRVFEENGYDCVCSEVMPTVQHMRSSKHNSGYAKDFTFKHIPDVVRHTVAQKIFEQIRDRLTREYDVVKHKSHVHIEFDPK